MDDKKVTWVLGAGFSKPLGAPLLNEVFDYPALDRAKSCLEQQIPEKSTRDHIISRFEKIPEYLESSPARHYWTDRARQHWRDAEAFLEMLDVASKRDHASRKVVRMMLAPDVTDETFSELARDVRRYIATVCHSAIDKVDVIRTLEKWTPFRTWVRTLRSNDTVISFNYDLVVERLFDAEKINSLRRLEPTLPLNDDVDLGPPHLVKLHGSCDWKREVSAQGLDVLTIENPITLIGNHHDIGIVGPGPSKRRFMETPFGKKCQAAAQKALEEADAIVLVGYRCPETDADAKALLLHSIRKNQNVTAIRIVLGDHEQFDVKRLVGMLHWCTRGKDTAIIPEPMYSQDFLHVFQREHLFEPTTC